MTTSSTDRPPTPKVLVSVRSVDEALAAADAGADLIDLKEPGRGALGDLPPETIAAIVTALRARGEAPPISATIGDVPLTELATIVERVEATAAAGVDIVKVGIAPDDPAAASVLSWLAGCGRVIVPVFIADRGIDLGMVRAAAKLGFVAVMLDTADKQGGSLLDRYDDERIRGFVEAVHDEGREAGIAGALRGEQADRIAASGADFAGFRTAVCDGDRRGTLDPTRLRALRGALATAVLRCGLP